MLVQLAGRCPCVRVYCKTKNKTKQKTKNKNKQNKQTKKTKTKHKQTKKSRAPFGNILRNLSRQAPPHNSLKKKKKKTPSVSYHQRRTAAKHGLYLMQIAKKLQTNQSSNRMENAKCQLKRLSPKHHPWAKDSGRTDVGECVTKTT